MSTPGVEKQSVEHDDRRDLLALMQELRARSAALIEVLEAIERQKCVPLLYGNVSPDPDLWDGQPS